MNCIWGNQIVDGKFIIELQIIKHERNNRINKYKIIIELGSSILQLNKLTDLGNGHQWIQNPLGEWENL